MTVTASWTFLKRSSYSRKKLTLNVLNFSSRCSLTSLEHTMRRIQLPSSKELPICEHCVTFIMCDINSSKTMLCEIPHLLHIALTIPVTSATAEGTFSALRRLKTFLRSSMTQPRLNHVMLLHIHKEKFRFNIYCQGIYFC